MHWPELLAQECETHVRLLCHAPRFAPSALRVGGSEQNARRRVCRTRREASAQRARLCLERRLGPRPCSRWSECLPALVKVYMCFRQCPRRVGRPACHTRNLEQLRCMRVAWCTRTRIETRHVVNHALPSCKASIDVHPCQGFFLSSFGSLAPGTPGAHMPPASGLDVLDAALEGCSYQDLPHLYIQRLLMTVCPSAHVKLSLGMAG